MKLTKKEARRIILLHQYLLQNKTLKGKDGVMTYIKRMGCLQFDPLNVIAMNPHLVLQSRIKNYKKEMLNELLYKDRALIDGWDKCMSIYPIEDRPYFKRYFDTALETHTWRDKKILDYVPMIKEKITELGPVTSKDIAIDDKIDWSWAPTSISRAVLDLLFFTGDLTIYKKMGSRKVYDFSENHLPKHILDKPDPNPSDLDYFKWGILRRINALGLMWDKRSEAWLGIKNLKAGTRKEAFESLVTEGKLMPFSIEGLEHNFYMPTENLKFLEELDKRFKRKVHFIAALDNFIWDRPLIKVLFNFDYKWEVYTPVKERKYGYYVLPILFGDAFIGRIEPRFNEKTKILTLHNIWIDTKEKNFEKPLKKALKEFAEFLGATTIQYDEESSTMEALHSLFPLEEFNSKARSNN